MPQETGQNLMILCGWSLRFLISQNTGDSRKRAGQKEERSDCERNRKSVHEADPAFCLL